MHLVYEDRRPGPEALFLAHVGRKREPAAS